MVYSASVLTAQASPLATLLPLYLMLALMRHFVSCTVLSLCQILVCKLCAPSVNIATQYYNYTRHTTGFGGFTFVVNNIIL